MTNPQNPETAPATILVVDDDQGMVELLVDFINAIGTYGIITARSGHDALMLAAKKQPDLIFLDIMMEDMDGTDVCKALKSSDRTRGIPVVAITAIHKVNRKRYNEILSSGVDGYVEKPFTFDQLESTIHTHILN